MKKSFLLQEAVDKYAFYYQESQKRNFIKRIIILVYVTLIMPVYFFTDVFPEIYHSLLVMFFGSVFIQLVIPGKFCKEIVEVPKKYLHNTGVNAVFFPVKRKKKEFFPIKKSPDFLFTKGREIDSSDVKVKEFNEAFQNMKCFDENGKIHWKTTS